MREKHKKSIIPELYFISFIVLVIMLYSCLELKFLIRILIPLIPMAGINLAVIKRMFSNDSDLEKPGS